MLGFSILASAALKGSIVLGAATLAAWTLRKRSASARHLVWTAAAAALLAIPTLSLVLPALPVSAKPAGVLAVFQVFSSGRAGAASPQPAVPGQTTPTGRTSGAVDLRPWVVRIWAAGAGVGILQMLFACVALWRLRRGARPFDCAGLPEALGIRHRVDVLLGARHGMPMTFGVFRPTVLLPAEAEDWSAQRLRVVLLHELSHVRRGDVATHLLGRTALAVYWWNPLAWHAWREFLRERERATDDLVLHAGERASDYAGHLIEVARSMRPATATAWAAIAMARRSELEGRLIAILDSDVRRKPSGRRAPMLAVVLAVGLAAPFAAIEAQDPAIPLEADATVRMANAQKNHEILDHAAAAYEKVAKYDVAQKLLENSLAIREQVSGSQSAAYALGLVKLGELAAKRRQTGEAVAFYSKAVSLGDRPEVAPGLLYLGTRAFETNDRPLAQNYFERVLNVETRGVNAGRALMWLAVMRQAAPEAASEAELLYQKSLAALEPGSFEAVNTLTNYARLVRRQNRTAEADQLDAKAHQIRQSLGIKAYDIPVTAGVYRVGGSVSAPALLYKVEPGYTEEARAAKFQGTVLLYVDVEPDGTADNIRVVRGLGLGLDEKAIEAIRQWKFRPGVKDGLPVPVAATIEVNFRLL